MSKSGFQSDERYIVPNLDRALVMIEQLSHCPRGMNVSELSAALGIPKNSAFRISVTMENRGFLEREEKSKRYRLTPRLLMLGAVAATDASLFERSADVMRRLRDRTQETALIGMLTATDGVVLDQAMGTHPFKFAVDAGTRFMLHTAAPGKAMLAALPVGERKRRVEAMAFPRFTASTICSAAAFLKHLDEVAKRRYAFDLGEEHEGQTCVGAAILGATGGPIAALWITAPSARIPDGKLDEIGETVRAHADEISGRFGALIGTA
jgi:DNA-binding IclR family transcriptional regulator